jgi:2,5-diketo-D-gluconate reductase A
MTLQTSSVMLAGGVQMPLVGFGTWQLRGRAGYEAVRYALEVGYRHVDTATMYGNETEVGRALRDCGLDREEVFVTTKLQPGDAGREREVLRDSLRALDCGYVDLWLIHSPPWRRAGLATWQAFLELLQEGQVRAVGVSNYHIDQIDLLTGETGQAPAVNQIPWSPALHDPQVLAEHRRRSVVLEGYSPIKRTRLRDPLLVEIAAAHGVTPAQVVLRWHVQHQIPVIPKSGSRERIASNADLFGFTLSPEEMTRLDTL